MTIIFLLNEHGSSHRNGNYKVTNGYSKNNSRAQMECLNLLLPSFTSDHMIHNKFLASCYPVSNACALARSYMYSAQSCRLQILLSCLDILNCLLI
jgi:hypothetical protein